MCGDEGIIINKNFHEYQIDSIKIDRFENDYFTIANIFEYNNRIHALGYHVYNNSLNTKYYHFVKVNESWEVKSSFIINSTNREYMWGNLGFKYFNNNYYSYGENGLYKYSNNEWYQIYDGIKILNILFFTDSDYLITSTNGTVYHINNSAAEEITKLRIENALYTDIFQINMNILIIGWQAFDSHSGTILWHGH
jgi:hypothetical protein